MDLVSVILWIVFALSLLVAVVGWIVMMINAAQNKKWAWFVIMLVLGITTVLLGIIASIIYRMMAFVPPRGGRPRPAGRRPRKRTVPRPRA